MVRDCIFVYGRSDRFTLEGNYYSGTTIIPQVDAVVEYLKDEIEKISSINQKKDVTIGIGIVGDASFGIKMAREASERKELSDELSIRNVETELREYSKRFINVKSVSINTGACHICKRPIYIIGNYKNSTTDKMEEI